MKQPLIKSGNLNISVEVGVNKLTVDVQGHVFNVIEELSTEYLGSAIPRAVIMYAYSHELKRRLRQYVDNERKKYMAHWRYWATRWLKAKGMTDVKDNVESVVAQLFCSRSLMEQIELVLAVENQLLPAGKEYKTWRDFFLDEAIAGFVRKTGKEMFKLEIEQGINYTLMTDMESSLEFVANTLESIANGYREKGFAESKKLPSAPASY